MDKYLQQIISNDVPVITFKSLDKIDFIKHGFSTRLGGVSKGIYKSMNLSFHRNDSYEDVMENYRIIGNKLGIDRAQMVLSAQTHTTNIKRVTKEDCGKGIIKEQDYSDVDGIMTNEKGVALVTSYADCVPLYFVDVIHKAIALSHSGWRGTVNRMGEVTIRRMEKEFGTKPSDLICVIGPSICQNCYEVSEDVIVEFKKNFEKKYWNNIFEEKQDKKYLLNLWEANRIILETSGVKPNNIENRKICTCCNKEVLFSHRGLHGKRGNLSAFLMIN